ncbi:MAG: ABC transporter permease [Dysgonomonas sp.]
MNLELFIARRIYRGNNSGNKVSSPAIKIAIAGIALGITAMILSVCIVIGFKKGIRDKISGFTSHIQITNFDFNSTYETNPICVSDSLLNELKNRDDVAHVETFATISGIIKTEEDFQGIVLKGVGKDYDWKFFQENLVEGQILNSKDSINPNDVIISKYIADKLGLKLGDAFITYFVQEPIRTRKFNIVGIYSTNFEDYDKMYVIINIETVRKLNNWETDQVSGIELYVKDFDKIDEVRQDLFFDMASYHDRAGNSFFTRSVKDMNPMIFSWLGLLDMNVWIIIILMILVSGVTMISGLLILILERTNMIGIMKALGASNFSIRKVFLYVSSFLILKGMIYGNVIALAICFIQKQFGILKLNPSTYYISEVPVELNVVYILLINIGAFLAAMLMMVGPSYLIARISPAKSIRFE